jgi:hypothetical protein
VGWSEAEPSSIQVGKPDADIPAKIADRKQDISEGLREDHP